MPERIQRTRTKGSRLPPNTVCVTRPGKHGNPYFPGSGRSMGRFDENMQMVTDPPTPANCVKWFRTKLESLRDHEPAVFKDYIEPLRGKNLACWCKPGEPCHADVLIEFANPTIK